MKVYASDRKNWDVELKASGKTIKPSHPYDLERDDDKFPSWFFFPIGWILRFFVELWP